MRRFLNLVYAHLVRYTDENGRDRLDRELEAPLPGRTPATRARDFDDGDAEASMTFFAALS